MNSEKMEDVKKLINCCLTIENYVLKIIPKNEYYRLKEQINDSMFHLEEALDNLEN